RCVLAVHVAVARDHDHAIVDAAVLDDRGEVRVDALLHRLDLAGHAARVVDADDDVHRALAQRRLALHRGAGRGAGVGGLVAEAGVGELGQARAAAGLRAAARAAAAAARARRARAAAVAAR